MSITRQEYEEMVRRVALNHKRLPGTDPACLRGAESADLGRGDTTAVSDESALHRQIIQWCDAQWPRVLYIHSRMDKRTRSACGVPDFVCFLPGGRTLVFECKTKTGKLSFEQMALKVEMERLGHTVHIVRHLEDFLALIGQTWGK